MNNAKITIELESGQKFTLDCSDVHISLNTALKDAGALSTKDKYFVIHGYINKYEAIAKSDLCPGGCGWEPDYCHCGARDPLG